MIIVPTSQGIRSRQSSVMLEIIPYVQNVRIMIMFLLLYDIIYIIARKCEFVMSFHAILHIRKYVVCINTMVNVCGYLKKKMLCDEYFYVT